MGGVPNWALAIWTDACEADVDDGNATGFPDRAVNVDDLIYFLDRFELGHLTADVADGAGEGQIDNAVTIEDLVYYLERFDDGC